jgi:putative restriction endonuclease
VLRTTRDLCADFGQDVPYRGGLDRGFAFQGQRVPYLSPQKGIFRARVQKGPAALSIQTSYRSPYGDEETDEGFRYAYRAGSIDQPDNRALRAAFDLGVPLVYFVGTRPGWYQPHFPCFVVDDDPGRRIVLVTKGRMVGPLDEQEPVVVEDPIERRSSFAR